MFGGNIQVFGGIIQVFGGIIQVFGGIILVPVFKRIQVPVFGGIIQVFGTYIPVIPPTPKKLMEIKDVPTASAQPFFYKHLLLCGSGSGVGGNPKKINKILVLI